MNLNLKKWTASIALFGLIGLSFAQEVKLTKGKALIQVSIPPLVELAPKEATYKFLYPRELTYYNEKEFSKFSTGFNDVDGLISQRPRFFLPKRILGNIPTDYTFELITNGVQNLKPVNVPYSSSSFNSTFIQEFQYNFSCILKIYKKDQLVKEFVLDDGLTPHADVYFANYRMEESTQEMPYLGFSSVEALEQSIVKNSFNYTKFCYIVEYKAYRKLFERACFAILNLYGEFNFKYNYPVAMVHEKDAANHTEFNSQATVLMNMLTQITKFDDIKANVESYRKLGDYFDSFSAGKGIDKDFKSASLRNAAMSYIMAGNMEKALELIKVHDNIGLRIFGSARSILYDPFDMRSAYVYYSTLADGVPVEGTSLNDIFDKELKAKQKEADDERRARTEERQRLADLAKVALEEKYNQRNFIDVDATVYYTNKSELGYGVCTFIFYKEDINGEVEKRCGYNFTALNPPKDPMVCTINNLDKIVFTDKKGIKRTLMTVTIVQSPLRRLEKLLNDNKLMEFIEIVNEAAIFLDRTDKEDNAFIIVPLNNNSKRKGYRLADIIRSSTYPEWLKSNAKVEQAIKSGQITMTLEGARNLCKIITNERLPKEAL